MFWQFALTIVLLASIALNVSEGTVRTAYTWRSYIQSPGDLLETFKSKQMLNYANFIEQSSNPK